MEGPFLAIDWGTTNRRVYRIGAGGAVEADERDGRGILSVAPGDYPLEAAAIRARFGDLPMLCAGMVGSNRGWRETAYLPCPVRHRRARRRAGLGRTGPDGDPVPASSCLATGPT